MKYTRCLEILRAPVLGVLFGALALGLSTPSARALDVQGCIKLDGKLTKGVTVEAFDVRTCTSLLSTVTDANGDFVLWAAAGQNRNLYLQITAPDGCIEIVDNATVCNSIITDPSDPRYLWVALCVDVKCACVPCTTGISKVVLQYLGTTTQPITAWATGSTTGSKAGSKKGSKKTSTIGTIATATTCTLWGKTGHKAGHKCIAACQPVSGSKAKASKAKTGSKGSKGTTPITPIFASAVQPCTTFTITLPTTTVSGSKGSKGVKTSSKGTKTGSKKGSKGSSKGKVTGLTLFVGANVNTRLDLSCSTTVTNGQIIGMFKVIRLDNAQGQRVCKVPRPPQTGNCITSGKPNQITFQYNGGNCSTAVNSQPRGTKYNCTDSGAIAAGPVRIVISSSATPSTTGFFAGNVTPGQTFVVRAGGTGTKSKSGFSSNTYAYIYSGGVLVERIQIHTSCSAPLIPGETFGALKLITYAIVP